jgi:hypothetical protein
MLTEKGIKVLEERHSQQRDFFPRLPKSDPVVKWMQFPSHSMILEVPHFGFGYDASRFCYVLAVREGEEEDNEEGDDEEKRDEEKRDETSADKDQDT